MAETHKQSYIYPHHKKHSGDLTLSGKQVLRDTHIEIDGKAVFYELLTFKCENSKITAHSIELPYRDSCVLV